MKQIYNKLTHESNLIEDNQTPPEGWTDKTPNWTEFEAWDYENDFWGESGELKLQAENNKKIADARQYLSETDYKIIKQMELGEVCPADILDKRAEYRKIINEMGKI